MDQLAVKPVAIVATPVDEHERSNASVYDVRIIHEYWKASQSQFRYRPLGVLELGDLDEPE